MHFPMPRTKKLLPKATNLPSPIASRGDELTDYKDILSSLSSADLSNETLDYQKYEGRKKLDFAKAIKWLEINNFYLYEQAPSPHNPPPKEPTPPIRPKPRKDEEFTGKRSKKFKKPLKRGRKPANPSPLTHRKRLKQHKPADQSPKTPENKPKTLENKPKTLENKQKHHKNKPTTPKNKREIPSKPSETHEIPLKIEENGLKIEENNIKQEFSSYFKPKIELFPQISPQIKPPKRKRLPIIPQSSVLGTLETDIPDHVVRGSVYDAVNKTPPEDRLFLVSWKPRPQGPRPEDSYCVARELKRRFPVVLLEFYEKKVDLSQF